MKGNEFTKWIMIGLAVGLGFMLVSLVAGIITSAVGLTFGFFS